MTCNVLLVGAGITSSVIGASLRKKFQDQVRLIVWDKANGVGGRMSTSRSPGFSSCLADLGAQYITSSPANMSAHEDLYNNLITHNLLETFSSKTEGLKAFPAGTKHFVAPQGMNSVVKHLFADSRSELIFNHHVCSITKRNEKWEVRTKSGVEQVFDIVVVTIPIPQILDLAGNIQEVLESPQNATIRCNLEKVKYSSRYALGLFYNDLHVPNVPWDVKYFTDNEVIRYIAYDNKKRNRPNEPTAVVIHTSVSFGQDYLDKSLGEVQNIIIEHVKNILPELTEPASVKCHKWRYSQVTDPFHGSPGSVTLFDKPLLILGGDGFTNSNFDGCISSALKVTDEIVTYVQLKHC